MISGGLGSRVRTHIRSNVYGLLALFIALSGVAYATAVAPKNSVVSRSIKNGQVKKRDLADGAVNSAKVRDGTLSGADLAGNTLGGAQIDENSIDPDAINQTCRFTQYTTASPTIGPVHRVCFSGIAGSTTFGNAALKCALEGMRLPTPGEILQLADYVGVHHQTVSMTSWIDGLYTVGTPAHAFTGTVATDGALTYGEAAVNSAFSGMICVYHLGVA